MSMHSYPEYGIGLVFVDECGNDEITPLIERLGSDDVYDFVNSPFEGMNPRFYDDEMEGKQFVSFDGCTSSEPDAMLVFWLSKQPDPFSPVYSGYEEMIAEFQNTLAMPDDFDWKAHLGWFQCTIYC